MLIADKRDTNLSHLVEFQTPTNNFSFHCSIFYSDPKIVKIIIYILYICKNLSTISSESILICAKMRKH